MPRRRRDISLPLISPDSDEPVETPRSEEFAPWRKQGLQRSQSAGSASLAGSASGRSLSSNEDKFGVQISLGGKEGPHMGSEKSRSSRASTASRDGKGLRRSATGLVVVHEDGRTLLHDAVMRGDIRKVKQFLSNECPANAATKGGTTPLHFAAMYKRMAVAQLLLEQMATIGLKDERGLTPLHLAAEYASSPIVNLFIQKSAKVDAVDDLENTPLHVAALKGNIPIIGYLLEAGADVNARNAHGYTPIAIAEECSTPDVVELLNAGEAWHSQGSMSGLANWHAKVMSAASSGLQRASSSLARLRASSSRLSGRLNASGRFTRISGNRTSGT